MRTAATALCVLLALAAAPVAAQETGGSFGGSRGFGGSSSSGGGGSSYSGGGGGGSSFSGGGSSSSRARERREERRREAEDRARAEREQREAAERRREELRREEERRAAEARRIERERLLALPPAERAAQLPFLKAPERPGPAAPVRASEAVRPPNAFGGSQRWTDPPERRPIQTGHMRSFRDGLAGAACFAVSMPFFVLFGLVIARAARASARRRAGRCEVRRLSIGFDWTARRKLQEALEAEAGQHDMKTAAGMHAAARDVQSALREALPAARYAVWQSLPGTPDNAEEKLQRITSDMRTRYRREVVRNDRRAAATPVKARAEEGEGLVVVTLVIGATRWLPRPPKEVSPRALASALAELIPSRPDELVALEVVWSPAEEQDRMSSAELEALYPELLRLDEDPELGRHACSYCRGVFTAELDRCPMCGAPD